MVPKIKVQDYLVRVLPNYQELALLSDEVWESSSKTFETNAKLLMRVLCECGQLFKDIAAPWLLNVPNPVPKNKPRDLIDVGEIGNALDFVVDRYKLDWDPPGPANDLRIFYEKTATRRRGRVVMTLDIVIGMFTPVSDSACRIFNNWGEDKAKVDPLTWRMAKRFVTYALVISGLLALPSELGYDKVIPDAIQFILTEMSELGQSLSQEVGFGMSEPMPIFPGNAITIEQPEIRQALDFGITDPNFRDDVSDDYWPSRDLF